MPQLVAGPQVYSIRQSLQGLLVDFLKESGITCPFLAEITRELVGLLAAYREEDTPLYPHVYVFDALDGLRALAPGAAYFTVGEAPLNCESAAKVVKNCAPLALGGWSIFVVKRGQDKVDYGLFRSSRHSLSISAEESIVGLGKSVPALLVKNSGHLSVELISSIGKRFYANLKTTLPQSSEAEVDVARFAAAATATLGENPEFQTYFRRLLLETVQSCHGTLLAVVDEKKKPKGLKDGVWPNPALDFLQLHTIAVASKTADALADLNGVESLLTGMMNSDGVLVFSSNAKLLAYRVFLFATAKEKTSIPESGGGRRRTFELMKLRLNKPFRAVFFRSQDGETNCEAL
jgi:hypothetical protein